MISVVLSVYNGASHLAETIESILGQTETDLELIAVNDGSSDGSGAILDGYAARDPRVRPLHQNNRGLTRALIAGCAAARGVFIARQDAGDLSHALRLETQKGMLLRCPELVFVSCATQFAGPELEPLWVARPSGAALEPTWILDLSRPQPMADGPTHHGSVMFRRDAYERVGSYRDAFYYGQDFDLWFRLAEVGRFQTTEQVLYTARVTPESISSRARDRQTTLARLSRAALEARQRGEDDHTILEKAASVRPVAARLTRRARASGMYFIGEALRRNRDVRARRYLRTAITMWPLSPRAWVRMVQSLLI